jgi:hypothetical protein
MEFLSKLTPEQLSVLKPEQISAIMRHPCKESDIAVMKHFFDTLTYTTSNREISRYKTPDCIYDKVNYDKFSDTLLRNSTDKFYLTCELQLHTPLYYACTKCGNSIHNNDAIEFKNGILSCRSGYNSCYKSNVVADNAKYYPINWKFHTESEILVIIPTGIQIEQICINNSMEKIKNKLFDLPIFFGLRDINRMSDMLKVEEFVLVHKNLHIVHPVFLTFANYFCGN